MSTSNLDENRNLNNESAQLVKVSDTLRSMIDLIEVTALKTELDTEQKKDVVIKLKSALSSIQNDTIRLEYILNNLDDTQLEHLNLFN